MHEASVMQQLLDLATGEMRGAGGTRIHRLTVRVGAASGVVPEALQFAFEAMKVGTAAAQAELAIEWSPLTLWCTDCDLEFEVECSPALCPNCGSVKTDLRQGGELDLANLEISNEG